MGLCASLASILVLNQLLGVDSLENDVTTFVVLCYCLPGQGQRMQIACCPFVIGRLYLKNWLVNSCQSLQPDTDSFYIDGSIFIYHPSITCHCSITIQNRLNPFRHRINLSVMNWIIVSFVVTIYDRIITDRCGGNVMISAYGSGASIPRASSRYCGI